MASQEGIGGDGLLEFLVVPIPSGIHPRANSHVGLAELSYAYFTIYTSPAPAVPLTYIPNIYIDTL